MVRVYYAKEIIDMAASSDRSSFWHFSNPATSCANPSARPRRSSAVPGVFALLLAGAISTHPVTAYAQGVFVATGTMNTARANPTMTVLKNGQVLVRADTPPMGSFWRARSFTTQAPACSLSPAR